MTFEDVFGFTIKVETLKHKFNLFRHHPAIINAVKRARARGW
jgi:hypothetical protein